MGTTYGYEEYTRVEAITTLTNAETATSTKEITSVEVGTTFTEVGATPVEAVTTPLEFKITPMQSRATYAEVQTSFVPGVTTVAIVTQGKSPLDETNLLHIKRQWIDMTWRYPIQISVTRNHV